MNCIVLEASAECLPTAMTLHLSLRAEHTGNNSLCMRQHTVASSTLLFFPKHVLYKNCKLVSIILLLMMYGVQTSTGYVTAGQSYPETSH
jgi:hypothetical protein